MLVGLLLCKKVSKSKNTENEKVKTENEKVKTENQIYQSRCIVVRSFSCTKLIRQHANVFAIFCKHKKSNEKEIKIQNNQFYIQTNN